MALQDLGNGLQYDPDTGATIIVNDQGQQVYNYNPGTNSTTFGGDTYAGMYNPLAIQQMNQDPSQNAMTSAFNTQQGFENNQINNLNTSLTSSEQNNPTNKVTTASPQSLSDQYWSNLNFNPETSDVTNQLQMNAGYSAALAANPADASFWTGLQNESAALTGQGGSDPNAAINTTGEYAGSSDVSAIMNNPNLTDAVKQAILGNLYNNPTQLANNPTETNATNAQIANSLASLAPQQQPQASSATGNAPAQMNMTPQELAMAQANSQSVALGAQQNAEANIQAAAQPSPATSSTVLPSLTPAAAAPEAATTAPASATTTSNTSSVSFDTALSDALDQITGTSTDYTSDLDSLYSSLTNPTGTTSSTTSTTPAGLDAASAAIWGGSTGSSTGAGATTLADQADTGNFTIGGVNSTQNTLGTGTNAGKGGSSSSLPSSSVPGSELPASSATSMATGQFGSK